ncbi:MAG: ATP-binding protein [Methanobrevibacter sp.]|jgi:hypothetical protein|nr:ATP-binding protein [Candidatus Methanovirga basalitermitum]
MDYEDILTALKSGNVPSEGASKFCIGRDKEIDEFKSLLERVENGKAFTKFINGEFGAGKSLFLKVIEEIALNDNFVVSWITLSNDIPFNKIDVVYKNIAKTLKCKTGISLEHIIDRWITNIKIMALEESVDPQKQDNFIEENIKNDLNDVRAYANPIAVAIENYYKCRTKGDNETADYILSWLKGDPNIPFQIKKRFGVKGDVNKETSLDFLKAISTFLKSIGYSGLVVLFDEAEFIMNLQMKRLRDIAYDYMRVLYDDCSLGKYSNTFFIFAGTPRFFDDNSKGIPSYEALNDRIENIIDSKYKDYRKPIVDLDGLKKENIFQIAEKLVKIHENVYKWPGSKYITYSILNSIVDKHEENTELTGGKSTPRIFIRSFISCLDTVEQNKEFFTDSNSILDLFESKELGLEDKLNDDW